MARLSTSSGSATVSPGLALTPGWWTLLGWVVFVTLLVVAGEKVPQLAYGTLALALLYLTVTHGTEVQALTGDLLAGLARPFQSA